MKRFLCIILILLILTVLIVPAKLFLIGDPVDGTQLYVETSEDGQNLRVYVHMVASAVALRGWKYRQDGSTLYIRARKVLVSPLFPSGSYETSMDTSLLSEIYLGGRLIWSK